MEEERRLAYVAITRAKDQLFVSHAKLRMLYGRTQCNPVSRFVGEIPDELIYEDIPRNTYYYSPSQTQQTARVYYSEPEKKPSSFDSYSFGGGSRPAQKTAQKGNLSLKEGDRVFHITFGEGEIMSAKAMGGDVLYEVVFDKVGTKKLMGTYAKLKKLN